MQFRAHHEGQSADQENPGKKVEDAHRMLRQQRIIGPEACMQVAVDVQDIVVHRKRENQPAEQDQPDTKPDVQRRLLTQRNKQVGYCDDQQNEQLGKNDSSSGIHFFIICETCPLPDRIRKGSDGIRFCSNGPVLSDTSP